MFDSESVARVCHEANRELQAVLGEETNLPWEECSAEMRTSAIDGVENARTGASPEESHENWLAFKQEHGWRHGEVKDEEARTHPCIVPYADLPEEQKAKDHLFTAIVKALS